MSQEINTDEHASYGTFEASNQDLQIFPFEPDSKFELTWSNVSYDITIKKFQKWYSWQSTTEVKRILHKLNGEMTGGQMTAMMGPSGAGKSTLLNCLANKQRMGVTGDIVLESRVYGPESTDFRIGFVPQSEKMYMMFTVKETLMFASRLNNYSVPESDHTSKVKRVIENLDLVDQADWRLTKLSGAQLKRVSLGTELISNPNILFLDEPTSGLDSDNSEKVITILKNLCSTLGKDTPAILATIYQPSAELFFMFDSVYLLSRRGRNLYNGPPSEVMTFMQSFGFTPRKNTNPADFIIAVANAKFGEEKFDEMSQRSQVSRENRRSQGMESGAEGGIGYVLRFDCSSNRFSLYNFCEFKTPISSMKKKQATSFWKQYRLCFSRNFMASAIESPTFLANTISGLIIGLFMCVIAKEPVGTRDACYGNGSYVHSMDHMDSVHSVDSLNPRDQTERIKQATEFFFMLLLRMTFTYAIAAVLNYPSEFKIVSREISNSWYSVGSYFFAKSTVDAILLGLSFFPMFFLIYFMSNLPTDNSGRAFILFYFAYTSGFLWEARAQFFSVIFHKNPTIAVSVTIGLMFPMYLYSGLFIQHNDITEFFKPLACTNDLKFAFEGMILSMYDGRCRNTTVVHKESNFKDENTGIYVVYDCFAREKQTAKPNEGSLIISFFTIRTNEIPGNIIYLFFLCLSTKLLILVAFHIKTSRNTEL